MTVEINGLQFPFNDYFQKHSENVLAFGQESRDIALKHVKQWRTAIDIGAHVGISVHSWATKFDTVVAFEPMKDHFECLVENTKKFNNIKLFNYGISNESRFLRGAYRTGKNSGSFQLLSDDWQPNPNKPSKIYKIPSRRLDEFNIQNVDLIKIDVEGWEFEVLKGAQETIIKNQPVLLVEFTGGSSKKSMTSYDVNEYNDLVKQLGYVSVGSIGDDTIYVPND